MADALLVNDAPDLGDNVKRCPVGLLIYVKYGVR